MRYRGIDVHSQKSVWCLLDQAGEVVAEGKTRTNTADLRKVAKDLKGNGAFRAGQNRQKATRACPLNGRGQLLKRKHGRPFQQADEQTFKRFIESISVMLETLQAVAAARSDGAA